jgi:hypothetical protein
MWAHEFSNRVRNISSSINMHKISMVIHKPMVEKRIFLLQTELNVQYILQCLYFSLILAITKDGYGYGACGLWIKKLGRAISMQGKVLRSFCVVNSITFLTDILSAIKLKMLGHMNNFIFSRINSNNFKWKYNRT